MMRKMTVSKKRTTRENSHVARMKMFRGVHGSDSSHGVKTTKRVRSQSDSSHGVRTTKLENECREMTNVYASQQFCGLTSASRDYPRMNAKHMSERLKMPRMVFGKSQLIGLLHQESSTHRSENSTSHEVFERFPQSTRRIPKK